MARIETRVKWCTRRHSRAAAAALGQTYAHCENEKKKRKKLKKYEK